MLWYYSFWHDHVAYCVHCRLNPSQTVNQLSAPKSVCCNSASAALPSKASGNHQLTEYFPVRRSIRKTKTTVLEEQQRDLEEAVLSQREEGLEVVCTQLFIQICLVNLIGYVVLREGKAVNCELGGVWSGMEWHGMARYCFCVGLLVAVFANIDHVATKNFCVLHIQSNTTIFHLAIQ